MFVFLIEVIFINFYKEVVCLSERQNAVQREERSSVCWFSPHVAATVGAGSVPNWGWECLVCVMWAPGVELLRHPLLLP